MVQVDLYLLFAHFHDTSVETLSLFVLQGNDGILIDVLVVEVSVNAEDFAFQVQYMLGLIVTVGLLLGDGEVEGVVLLQVDDLAFKVVECDSKTCDKLEWTLSGSLFHHLLVILFTYKQLVAQGDVLILLFHKFYRTFLFSLQR